MSASGSVAVIRRPREGRVRRRLRAYLELVRVPNLFTAPPDVIAGAAIGLAATGAAPALGPLAALAGASMLLYAGGVALNDVLDRRVDAIERPERPLPSGRATLRGARILIAACYAGALLLALPAGAWAVGLVAAVAAGSVTYDAWAKRTRFLGPPTMGLTRGFNLLLGTTLAGAVGVTAGTTYVLLPLTYITGVTLLSTGEVHGASTGRNAAAITLSLVAPLTLVILPLANLMRAEALPFALAHLALLAATAAPVLTDPRPLRVRQAVRTGILALALLMGALAAGHAGALYGLAAVAFAPVAWLAARAFQVT